MIKATPAYTLMARTGLATEKHYAMLVLPYMYEYKYFWNTSGAVSK